MDLLFFYRTPKKKKYFKKLSDHSVQDLKSKIVPYNFCLSLSRNPIKKIYLEKAQKAAVDQIFHSRSFFLSSSFKWIYHKIIKIHSKLLFKGLFKKLTNLQPSKVIIWNGLKYQDLVLKEALKSFPQIQLLHMENGTLPESTVLDAKGINAGSSITRDVKEILKYKLTYKNPSYLQGRAYIKKKQQKDKLPESYILVPFQMNRDSQILFYSPWIRDMRDLFHKTLNAFKDSKLSKSHHLVFREHPSTKETYPDLYQIAQREERVLFNSNSPLQEAISSASAVLTVNSSLGFEALLLDKKVIVLGEAFYNIPGLSTKVTNSRELFERFNKLSEVQPPDKHLKGSFCSYLKDFYLLDGDWKQPSAEHYKSFSEKIRKF